MGAWGTGIFEDDTALDALAGLRDDDDPLAAMRQAFESAREADYLDYDGACAALVGAAIVDAAGRRASLGEVGDEDGLDAWIGSLDRKRVVALSGFAADALAKVLSDASELRELWSENETDFPAWKGGIEALRGRLRNSYAG